jgi:SAM-dependent methyltransferase
VTTPDGAWFNPIAEFLGPAYWAPDSTKVQAFTVGTEQEVEFLVGALGLEPGMRVLDAGCGPGRHSFALGRRGIHVVGVDLSPDFIDLARSNAGDLPVEFHVQDVRDLAFENEFDAVICLCQGGFGLLGGGDAEHAVMGRFAAACKPGGRLAVSAFSSYFVVRHQEAADTFDPATGVNHEVAPVVGAGGEQREFDLWTTCYTPRELRLLAERAGLTVDHVFGVQIGNYAATPPRLDDHEYLLLAHRPH